MYSVGDLKNISVNKGTVSGETDLLNYKTTELYKSPIMMQISIRMIQKIQQINIQAKN